MPRLGGSDQDLIVRVGLGDLDCLGELFLRYHQPILNFAHRMIGDANAADSITQDVFVRVLRHADKFDPAQAVRPWLYTIAANLCRDYLSKQGRRNTVEMAVEPPAPLDGPLEQLATSEECARVKKAVQELPEIYREIVVMRIYEQLPYAEIAAALDIREGTARSRMEYALNRLRKALAPKEAIGSPKEAIKEPKERETGLRSEAEAKTNPELKANPETKAPDTPDAKLKDLKAKSKPSSSANGSAANGHELPKGEPRKTEVVPNVENN